MSIISYLIFFANKKSDEYDINNADEYIEHLKFKGIFAFSKDNEEKQDIIMNMKYIKTFAGGVLYKLEIEQESLNELQVSDIIDESHLGYFYITENDIFFKPLSKNEKYSATDDINIINQIETDEQIFIQECYNISMEKNLYDNTQLDHEVIFQVETVGNKSFFNYQYVKDDSEEKYLIIWEKDKGLLYYFCQSDQINIILNRYKIEETEQEDKILAQDNSIYNDYLFKVWLPKTWKEASGAFPEMVFFITKIENGKLEGMVKIKQMLWPPYDFDSVNFTGIFSDGVWECEFDNNNDDVYGIGAYGKFSIIFDDNRPIVKYEGVIIDIWKTDNFNQEIVLDKVQGMEEFRAYNISDINGLTILEKSNLNTTIWGDVFLVRAKIDNENKYYGKVYFINEEGDILYDFDRFHTSTGEIFSEMNELDINNDERKDIVLLEHNENYGDTIRIFIQQEDGQYRYANANFNNDSLVYSEVNSNDENVLTAEQQIANGEYIYHYLEEKGWSLYAICSLLGNVTVESHLNPAFITNNGETNKYGILQWDMTEEELLVWADENNIVIENKYQITAKELMDLQLLYCIYTAEPGSGENDGFWNALGSNGEYMSFEEYIQYPYADMEGLTSIFQENYLHSTDREDERKMWSERWFRHFNDNENILYYYDEF